MEIPVARRIKLIIPSKYPRFDHRTKHARYDIKENPIDCRDIEYKGKGNLKCLLINKVSILRQQWITSIVLDKHRQSCSMLVSMAASNFHFRTCNCNFPNFRLTSSNEISRG